MRWDTGTRARGCVWIWSTTRSGHFCAAQHSVEADFKRELARRHGIVFNSLYTITKHADQPFPRVSAAQWDYERYMDKLVNAYNPVAAAA